MTAKIKDRSYGRRNERKKIVMKKKEPEIKVFRPFKDLNDAELLEVYNKSTLAGEITWKFIFDITAFFGVAILIHKISATWFWWSAGVFMLTFVLAVIQSWDKKHLWINKNSFARQEIERRDGRDGITLDFTA